MKQRPLPGGWYEYMNISQYLPHIQIQTNPTIKAICYTNVCLS